MQNNGPRRETPGTKGGVRDSHPPPQQPAAPLKNLSHCFEQGRLAGQREWGVLTWGARSTAEHPPLLEGVHPEGPTTSGASGGLQPKGPAGRGRVHVEMYCTNRQLVTHNTSLSRLRGRCCQLGKWLFQVPWP